MFVFHHVVYQLNRSGDKKLPAIGIATRKREVVV